MSYNADQRWPDLVYLLAANAGPVKTALINAREAFEEWISFRAGRSDAQIAADLTAQGDRTVLESEIAAMNNAFYGLLYAHQFATGEGNPPLSNWFSDWRKFT